MCSFMHFVYFLNFDLKATFYFDKIEKVTYVLNEMYNFPCMHLTYQKVK
jgi:hypothetical protein